MSVQIRTAALFLTVALCSCLCSLVQEHEIRDAGPRLVADETHFASRRELRRPVAVVVNPRVAQDAHETLPEDHALARLRSFYNQPSPRAVQAPSSTSVNAEEDGLFPLAASGAGHVDAQPQFSSWASFPEGSWSRTRVSVQSLENGKIVESVTETRTTLVAVDFERKRYTLRYDSSIKMGGADHPRPPEIVEYNFWDEVADDDEREVDAEPVNLFIDQRSIPCRVRRLYRESGRSREVVTLWYSTTLDPSVLQRETKRETLRDGARESATRELSVVQKTTKPGAPATAIPSHEVLFSRTVGERAVTGSALRSSAIPGGLVHETSVEIDVENAEKPYRSETTLLDYYVAP